MSGKNEVHLLSGPSDSFLSAMSEKDDKRLGTLSLLDLVWEDILFTKIFPYLDCSDILNLRQVSPQYESMVDQYLKTIKSLNLTPSKDFLTLENFKILTRPCTQLKKFILHSCIWITDQDLIRIFKRNPFLAHLDLTDCTTLDGTCLLALSVHCKSLETLCLPGCKWVTQKNLETIMAHQKSITVIDLSSCVHLSNQTLATFIETYFRCTELHLAYIQSVDDPTLNLIAKSCKSLRHLDIRACSFVTDYGIKALTEYCTELKSLCVNHCNFITELSLGNLRSKGVKIDKPCHNNLLMPSNFVLRMQV